MPRRWMAAEGRYLAVRDRTGAEAWQVGDRWDCVHPAAVPGGRLPAAGEGGRSVRRGPRGGSLCVFEKSTNHPPQIPENPPKFF